jgi:uncharacterized protein (DUF427 family)
MLVNLINASKIIRGAFLYFGNFTLILSINVLLLASCASRKETEMRPQRIEPGPGQESVWDYPRPPRVERVQKHIEVFFNGIKIVSSDSAYRVLETSHPPVYYIPRADIRMEYLGPAEGTSLCEWKGRAAYFTVRAGDQSAERSAWSYPDPTPEFEIIKDHIAFYAGPMDRCTVDGERVIPQPGEFYGGWITKDIVGPFKGEPGTMGW